MVCLSGIVILLAGIVCSLGESSKADGKCEQKLKLQEERIDSLEKELGNLKNILTSMFTRVNRLLLYYVLLFVGISHFFLFTVLQPH